MTVSKYFSDNWEKNADFLLHIAPKSSKSSSQQSFLSQYEVTSLEAISRVLDNKTVGAPHLEITSR